MGLQVFGFDWASGIWISRCFAIILSTIPFLFLASVIGFNSFEAKFSRVLLGSCDFIGVHSFLPFVFSGSFILWGMANDFFLNVDEVSYELGIVIS